ncbi:MAG: hypothetical protein JWN44_1712, partial [Myxococcales bacterium]|nr:hypothetical protein [Myxococcales bacterium]
AQPTRTTELWDHVHFTPGPELVADAVGATPIVVADGSLYLLQPNHPTAERLVANAPTFVALPPQPPRYLDRARAFAVGNALVLVGSTFEESKMVPMARLFDGAGWSDVVAPTDDVVSCAGAVSRDRALVITYAVVDEKIRTSARLFDVAKRSWSVAAPPSSPTTSCFVAEEGDGKATLFATVAIPDHGSATTATPLELRDGAHGPEVRWHEAKRLDEDALLPVLAHRFDGGWSVMALFRVDEPRDAWRYHAADFRREMFQPPRHAAYARPVAIDSTHLLFTGGYQPSGDEDRDRRHPTRVADATLLTFPDKLTALAPMGLPRTDHFAALLPDGRVVVGGGMTTVSKPNVHGVVGTTAAVLAPLGLLAALILAYWRTRPAWWALVLAVAAGALVDFAIFAYLAASAIHG